jgi:hypothetical protein
MPNNLYCDPAIRSVQPAIHLVSAYLNINASYKTHLVPAFQHHGVHGADYGTYVGIHRQEDLTNRHVIVHFLHVGLQGKAIIFT